MGQLLILSSVRKLRENGGPPPTDLFLLLIQSRTSASGITPPRVGGFPNLNEPDL